jgi:hypothetical protein
MGYVSPYKSRFWMKLVPRIVNFWRVLIDILFYRSRLPFLDSGENLWTRNYFDDIVVFGDGRIMMYDYDE